MYKVIAITHVQTERTRYFTNLSSVCRNLHKAFPWVFKSVKDATLHVDIDLELSHCKFNVENHLFIVSLKPVF